jgi:hypothetical protein
VTGLVLDVTWPARGCRPARSRPPARDLAMDYAKQHLDVDNLMLSALG